MTQIVSRIKQTGEVGFSIDGYEVVEADIIIYISIWNHYMSANCSLEQAEYEIGGGRNTITVSGNQVESITDIPVSSKKRIYKLYWDAGGDLTAEEIFTDIDICLVFNDQPSSAGASSVEQLMRISTIDFTPTTDIIPYKPFPNDEEFVVKFKNLVSQSSVKLHFKIEVDTVNTFDSGDYSFVDTSVSQVNWTFDGGAFPGAGVDPVTDITQAEEITYTGFSGLADDTWFIRITRSFH